MISDISQIVLDSAHAALYNEPYGKRVSYHPGPHLGVKTTEATK
jgi:hypothetical protein